VKDIYETDADPGLHASAEWLLRTWKQEAWLKQVNDEWAKDKEQRNQRLEEHLPRCTALVPLRRQKQFVLGVFDAFDDETISLEL
jgi:hypothetical protein